MKKHVFIFSMAVLIFAIITTAQTNAPATGAKIIIDNDKLKVTEYTGMPGKDICGDGKHNHPAHLTILLTEATVKITTAEGKTVEQKVPAGAAFWSETETHTVVNNGTAPVKAYIIELKQ